MSNSLLLAGIIPELFGIGVLSFKLIPRIIDEIRVKSSYGLELSAGLVITVVIAVIEMFAPALVQSRLGLTFLVINSVWLIAALTLCSLIVWAQRIAAFKKNKQIKRTEIRPYDRSIDDTF